MAAHLVDWLHLALRWFHLIAGISWIGSSFYFMWLDASFEKPAKPKDGVEGELWMVHGGFFYQVEKRLVRPGEIPPTLHWFKWEATLTWVSGIFLLGVVYYLGDAVMLIDPAVARLTPAQAIGLSLGLIVVTWLVYDALWASKLAETQPALLTGISLVGLFAIAYGLCHAFSGRAAFIHLGAVLGTVMVANVWRRILPAQRKTIEATERNETPDYSLGVRAKRRSTHNSYVTLPVLFVMISNHFPATFGHAQNWLVLSLFIVLGMAIRHVMIAHSKKQNGWWALAPAGGALVGLIAMTAPKAEAVDTSGPPVSFATANDIVVRRCLSCHAATPTDDVFRVAPNGIVFDSPDSIRALAPRIKFRAVTSKTMPLANKTGMTDEERATLGRWIDQGARL